MTQLANKDKHGFLAFYDINQDSLVDEHPDIEFAKANAFLHAKTNSGEVITGLDVTYQAWRLVGRGWMIAPLRWPIFRAVADKLYLMFAGNRYQVSKWLTGNSRCEGSCDIRSQVKKKR